MNNQDLLARIKNVELSLRDYHTIGICLTITCSRLRELIRRLEDSPMVEDLSYEKSQLVDVQRASFNFHKAWSSALYNDSKPFDSVTLDCGAEPINRAVFIGKKGGK